MEMRDILRFSPVIPVIIIERLEHAVPLAKALCAGGLRVLEVTMRTPIALAAIEMMRKAVPTAIVGVGTLTRSEDFQAAARAGAQFGVSPGLTIDLAQASRTVNFPLLPGVMTPAEVIAARLQGFTALKLFPALQAGGIGMLKALASPFGKSSARVYRGPPTSACARPTGQAHERRAASAVKFFCGRSCAPGVQNPICLTGAPDRQREQRARTTGSGR